MNKIIKTIFIVLILTTSGISFGADKNDHKQGAHKVKHAASGMSHKMKRRKPQEGVFSVDLVSYGDRLNLLVGQVSNGSKALLYSYSDDEGRSWSKASIVLGDKALLVRASRGNDAQLAVQGKNVVAVWTKFVKENRFNSGPMQAARSIDGGISWQQAPAPPDWQKGPHGFADMAADNHAMYAVWLDSRRQKGEEKGRQGVRYARSIDGGLSWQKNLTLDGYSCSCCWNTVKADNDGNAFVLYRDKEPSDLSIGRVNEQQEWTYLSHVGAFDWHFEGCPHIGGGLDFQEMDGNKGLHAVIGTGHPDHLGVYYQQSNDGGKNWSKPTQFGDETAVHADLAAHEDGHVIAVWDMMGEEGLAVFMAESKDGGLSWSSPSQLSSLAARASHPRIVKTKSGFFAVWTASEAGHQVLKKRRL